MIPPPGSAREVVRRSAYEVVRGHQFAQPADTPRTNHAAQLLGECVADATGAPARYELCPGCLDTRWYSQLGIPAFGFGPGTFEVSHGPHECVDEDALHRVAAVYATFAQRLLR